MTARHSDLPVHERVCPECQTAFLGNHGRRVYCGYNCQHRAYRRRAKARAAAGQVVRKRPVPEGHPNQGRAGPSVTKVWCEVMSSFAPGGCFFETAPIRRCVIGTYTPRVRLDGGFR